MPLSRLITVLSLSACFAFPAFSVETQNNDVLNTYTIAQPVPGTSLENFYQVSDDLYRSDQPDSKQMKMLEEQGIKTILNLRFFHSDDKEAKGTGLNLQRVPMEAGRFDDEEIINALKVIKNSPKPVLVHCWHGSDRTGVVVAMYRIVFQNWSKEAAIDELKQPQFGHHDFAYRNIPSYIEQVDVAAIKRAIEAD